ncbi:MULTISPECIES: sulfite exporter TauE/SafE family protein [Methylococcus]|uniref:Probable membrane transporter protein n=1 Tax=Methylococcus capsulatus TaxID=414 RepID=A0ABZ2F3X1_METCP|nr:MULTISPECIES: sulfite exporter TauE/SafE family protein [Methylococcus]MDF9392833.1 sulfite exporter TauE/SafE family protein [Methylococcus capsulatus]
MNLALVLALGIGLLLGLLGGGGSVLMVPMLVYVAGFAPKQAITTSLVVVGVTSLTALLGHIRGSRVCWKMGAVFGLAGMAGAYGGGRAAAVLPGGILLILFGLVMLATSVAMLRGRRGGADVPSGRAPLCPLRLPLFAVLFDGGMVGALTGLVGAGGGFMIVPALNLLGRLPMHAAVATSLLVVAMNSLAALLGYAGHVQIRYELVGPIAGAAVAGSLVGGWLAGHLGGTVLRRTFGGFVAMVAVFLLYRELTPERLDAIGGLVAAHPDFFRGAAAVLAVMVLSRLRGWLHARYFGADRAAL